MSRPGLGAVSVGHFLRRTAAMDVPLEGWASVGETGDRITDLLEGDKIIELLQRRFT